MAKHLHTSIATVILAGALSIGGASFAAAHHGNAGEHKAKLSGVEIKERQITAELNRKQLMQPQIAALETPAQTPAILLTPMPSDTPTAMPSEDAAATMPAEPAEEDAAN
jgi:hypothetical protein